MNIRFSFLVCVLVTTAFSLRATATTQEEAGAAHHMTFAVETVKQGAVAVASAARDGAVIFARGSKTLATDAWKEVYPGIKRAVSDVYLAINSGVKLTAFTGISVGMLIVLDVLFHDGRGTERLIQILKENGVPLKVNIPKSMSDATAQHAAEEVAKSVGDHFVVIGDGLEALNQKVTNLANTVASSKSPSVTELQALFKATLEDQQLIERLREAVSFNVS